MKKYLKYLGYTLGGLLGLVLVIYGIMSYLVHRRTTRQYRVSVNVPDVRRTEAMIKRGRHVARIRSCRDCHGNNFSGEVFINDPMMGQYAGSNLTTGKGGVGDQYNAEDWTRAIRHGIGADGSPLIFMPSYEYDTIGNRDLAALIAYLESLPPVDNEPPPVSIGPMSKFLYLTGGLPQLVAAEQIDHKKQRGSAPQPGPTVEYGRYLATSCTGCHGSTLSGGPIPGVPPSWPKAPNLTPHKTGLADWTYEEFETMLRTGKTPEGRTVNSRHMPWKNFRHMSDTEVRAVWFYLQNLDPKAEGNR